jgi:hypothetical protein
VTKNGALVIRNALTSSLLITEFYNLMIYKGFLEEKTIKNGTEYAQDKRG